MKIMMENLLKDQLKNLSQLSQLSTKVVEIQWPETLKKEEKEAIDVASAYDLEYEVAYAMFNEGLSPQQALRKWDCIIDYKI